MKRLVGIPASRGICIGPVFQFVRQEIIIKEGKATDPTSEFARLDDAISVAKEQISSIYQRALKEAGKAEAEIFLAHKIILDDPEFISAVRSKIT